MDGTRSLAELQLTGRMTWRGSRRGWVASPGEVIDALARDGFEEYRREVARGRAAHQPQGGVWQGLNRVTGEVASAIWVCWSSVPETLVFVDIQGEPVKGLPQATPSRRRDRCMSSSSSSVAGPSNTTWPSRSRTA